jgi:hypothetical protein
MGRSRSRLKQHGERGRAFSEDICNETTISCCISGLVAPLPWSCVGPPLQTHCSSRRYKHQHSNVVFRRIERILDQWQILGCKSLKRRLARRCLTAAVEAEECSDQSGCQNCGENVSSVHGISEPANWPKRSPSLAERRSR